MPSLRISFAANNPEPCFTCRLDNLLFLFSGLLSILLYRTACKARLFNVPAMRGTTSLKLRKLEPMKTVLLISICLLFLSVGAFSAPTPVGYEYKFEYKMNEKKANELGSLGWELAAIESPSTAGVANNVPTYVFKRAK